MSEKINSYCVVCGKGYHLCMSCKDAMSLAPYKVLTDTSEHYKIYQVIKGYNSKVYSKKEAKEILSNLDLTDKDTFIKSVLNKINEIMADVKAATTTKSNKDNINVEVTTTETSDVVETKDNVANATKSTTSRKKRVKSVETE